MDSPSYVYSAAATACRYSIKEGTPDIKKLAQRGVGKNVTDIGSHHNRTLGYLDDCDTHPGIRDPDLCEMGGEKPSGETVQR